jgi:hypothetical protein
VRHRRRSSGKMGRLRFELSRLGRHRLSEERWRSPQRIASRTLFCDDLVYLEGGRLSYFGVRGATLGNPAVSFEVGSAEVDDLPAVSRYLSGPRRRARREAGCQLLLFGMENMDDDVDLLRRRGFGVTFRSRAEADAEVRSHRDACEFCADALIRKAAAATRRRSIQEPESMLHRRCRHRQIPAQLCRDVIHTMIAGCPEGRGLG